MSGRSAKPSWLRVKIPGGENWKQVSSVLANYDLHTVCDGARCPNKGECWGSGTAAFMILGDTCTRSCRFCAVPTARRGRPVEASEGDRIAGAAEELGLSYVVLTSVDRDDLPDRGAAHFAACIRAIRGRLPQASVEVLIPDYAGGELELVATAAPAVLAHNVETIPSLQGLRDQRASFEKSLLTLREAKTLGLPLTKSSILLGLGEREEEVLAAMDKLREAGVDILVLGQYLRPSPSQVEVAEYVHPDAFSHYAEEARKRGFFRVVSSPLARTSFHAREAAGQRPVLSTTGNGPVARTDSAVHSGSVARPGNIAHSGSAAYSGNFEIAGKPEGCKLIRLRGKMKGGILREFSIRGDFFASPEEVFDRVEARLAGLHPEEIGPRFDALLTEEGVEAFGISGAALGELLAEALAPARGGGGEP